MAKTEIRAVPFVSVNEIAFGTPREEVWKSLGKPGDSFHKGDGFAADRSKWFLSEQAESAT